MIGFAQRTFPHLTFQVANGEQLPYDDSKSLFTTYLVLNLILEGIAAVTLVGAGLELFTIAQLESGIWSMNYGFAAMSIASAIFWVWPHRSKREVVGPVLGILLVFHALVSVSFAIQGTQVPAIVVHGIMALLGIFLYTRRSAWCNTPSATHR